MRNPISSDFRHLTYYLLLWTVVSAVHFLLLFREYEFGIQIALTDSLLFNFTFAIFSLGLWYVVKYSLWDEKDTGQVLINLFAAALIIISFWISFNELLLRWIFAQKETYISFLKEFRIWRISFGFFFYILSVLIYYVVMYYLQLQDKKVSESELKRNFTEARLNILRSQVNPHFLFNSLNSISSLTVTDSVKARKMIGKLSDFLRFSLSQDPNVLISLSEELENNRKYLEIEKVRFEDKMGFKFDIQKSCMDLKVPNMIIQPLFENAIKYGVQENLKSTEINCKAFCNESDLIIEIINDLEDFNNTNAKGTGFGQRQIAERLFLIYKGEAESRFYKENSSYVSRIRIPINSKVN